MSAPKVGAWIVYEERAACLRVLVAIDDRAVEIGTRQSQAACYSLLLSHPAFVAGRTIVEVSGIAGTYWYRVHFDGASLWGEFVSEDERHALEGREVRAEVSE